MRKIFRFKPRNFEVGVIALVPKCSCFQWLFYSFLYGRNMSYRRDGFGIKASDEVQLIKHIIWYRLCTQHTLAHKLFTLTDWSCCSEPGLSCYWDWVFLIWQMIMTSSLLTVCVWFQPGMRFYLCAFSFL